MSVVQPVGRPAVQTDLTDDRLHRRVIAEAVNRIMQGHFNASLFVTLDPNVASTAVVDSRISLQTCAALMPQTAHAAAALATTFVVCTSGSLVINHANNAQTDRTFTMGLIG